MNFPVNNYADFIEYLKQVHPYLYDIEQEIERIKRSTGYGEVFLTFNIKEQGGVVSGVEISSTIGKLYKKRENNKL